LKFVAFPSFSIPEDGVNFSWNVCYTVHSHPVPNLSHRVIIMATACRQ
jgi:hypothetical protein